MATKKTLEPAGITSNPEPAQAPEVTLTGVVSVPAKGVPSADTKATPNERVAPEPTR